MRKSSEIITKKSPSASIFVSLVAEEFEEKPRKNRSGLLKTLGGALVAAGDLPFMCRRKFSDSSASWWPTLNGARNLRMSLCADECVCVAALRGDTTSSRDTSLYIATGCSSEAAIVPLLGCDEVRIVQFLGC